MLVPEKRKSAKVLSTLMMVTSATFTHTLPKPEFDAGVQISTRDQKACYNAEYKDDMLLLIRTYNHYVHHVLAQKYQAECKNPGKYQDTVQMRNASRNRSRLQESRYEYAVLHQFPTRYKTFLNDRTIPNHSNVAFLPDPTLSLFPENHPNFGIDKKLSSLAFNKKKLDTVLVQYKIKEILQEEEEPEDGDNNGEDVVEDEIIDLEREESGQYFADGKWGNQYDDKDEDEDFEPEENNNKNYKEFDEEEMGG
ncbi:hypothetical protein PCASD_05673 [Puccinia coronata f. sp. avenae]|uniref:DNA-directed RNA polymerase III subunit n=1 Tax=Puccinia coronata f. sp. avenae TaxID=200324 RepID=A0A2N5UVJ5_9BASI|nr:hypothetical protein PCASD_05673 [Puccinia coronata f. sp. avenae]